MLPDHIFYFIELQRTAQWKIQVPVANIIQLQTVLIIAMFPWNVQSNVECVQVSQHPCTPRFMSLIRQGYSDDKVIGSRGSMRSMELELNDLKVNYSTGVEL